MNGIIDDIDGIQYLFKHHKYLYTEHVGPPSKVMSTKTNDRVVIKRSIGLNELIRQALAVGLPAGPSLYIIHIFTLEVLPATILYRLVYEFHHFDEVGVYHHPHALNGGCFPGFIYVTDYKRDASTHPILRLETEKSRNQATLSACFCQLGVQ